jgi:hypothetical protein
MNPTQVRPPTLPGQTAAHASPVASRFVCGVHLRASLPVVSNRAFIRAWAASRTRAGAAALAAKRLAK